MKLFSTEITTTGNEKIAKAVLLNKTRSGYSLLQNYITEPENLKSLSGNHNTYFCIDYFDTIIETLSIPPIKDPKTFKMLAKNKLKDHMDEGVTYLIAYKAVKKDKNDKSGNVEHKVYMVPESLFEEDAGLSERQKLKMNMFTLSDFAVMSVSNHFFPDEIVFHAFADEYKLMITVSKGNTIIYSRTMEYVSAEGLALESVFYESVNLTYMFVSKNMKIDVERMVLSGLLIDMPELSSMLFEFNHKPQSTIICTQLVRDCSRDSFHRFMIPISLCMLEDSYDFTPEVYKERRGFNRLKAALNIIAAVAVLIVLYMNLTAFEKLGFAKERLASETNVLELKLERSRDNFIDSGEKRFGLYYLKQMHKYESSAFDLFGELHGLLNTADYDNVRFDLSKKKPEIMIGGSVLFADLKEIDALRQKISGYTDQLAKSGKYKISDSSRYDMQGLKAEIKLKLEKVK